jgi:hypothetical protein
LAGVTDEPSATLTRRPEAQNGEVDMVPVRRDGTGRLVAIGLIEIVDADGEERWTTISGEALPGENLDEAIERSLKESLGPGVRGQLSAPSQIRPIRRRPDRHGGATRRTSVRGDGDETWAVEIEGRLAPQGAAHRFTWFIVTALPAQEQIRVATRPVLADFLEAQGEPGLAGRLRLF